MLKRILRNHTVRFSIRLIVPTLILYYVFRSVNSGIFWTTIYFSEHGLLLLLVILFLPTQILAAYRWYFLLKILECAPNFWSVVRYNILGQCASLFLPGQLSGDIVRTLAISRGKNAKPLMFLSVLIDKLSLLIAILIFTIFGLLTSDILSQFISALSLLIVILIVCLFMLLLLCRYRLDDNTKHVEFYRKVIPIAFIEKVMLISANVNMPRVSFLNIVITLLFGLVFQLLSTIGVYVLAQSMHIMINPLDWMAINALVSIAQIAPISIGGLGLREGVYAGILSLYGVPIAQATAFSLTGFVLVAFLLLCCWFVLESSYASKLWVARP
jgi:glycosyltransferase 2 family protein